MSGFRVRWCQLAFVGLVLLAGCFRSARHGDDERTCECCGTEVRVGAEESCLSGVCDPYCLHRPPTDAGMDAPVYDAPPLHCDCCGTAVLTTDGVCSEEICAPYCACELVRSELTEVDFVRAGSPASIRTMVRGCFCGERLECEVAVDERSRRIEMRTTMCVPDLLCDGCMDLETECAIPELSEGRWSVMINGDWAYELDALPPDLLPERLDDVLVTHAPVDEECGIVWPPEAYDPFFACITPEVRTGEEFAISVYDECAPEFCGHRGGHCKVTVLENVITVSPHRTFTECDIAACPPVCETREDVCWVPPLPEGGYNVVIGGDIRGRLLVTDTPAPSEACGPP